MSLVVTQRIIVLLVIVKMIYGRRDSLFWAKMAELSLLILIPPVMESSSSLQWLLPAALLGGRVDAPAGQANKEAATVCCCCKFASKSTVRGNDSKTMLSSLPPAGAEP